MSSPPPPPHQVSPLSVNFVLLVGFVSCPCTPHACLVDKNRFMKVHVPTAQCALNLQTSQSSFWTCSYLALLPDILGSDCTGLGFVGNIALNLTELGPEGHKRHKQLLSIFYLTCIKIDHSTFQSKQLIFISITYIFWRRKKECTLQVCYLWHIFPKLTDCINKA